MSENLAPAPVFLLADSQLLFWRDGGRPFLGRVRELLPDSPRVVYYGAANGDRPEFFQLFVEAMATVDIRSCRHVTARPSAEDRRHFARADLLLLAGGDVRTGASHLRASGLERQLVERYRQGAVLIGVSAGAVQLGVAGMDAADRWIETCGLLPFLIDAHREPEWSQLGRCLPRLGQQVAGLGIASGGGAAIHPDMTVEPIRKPVTELFADGDGLRRGLLLPPEAASADTAGPPDGATPWPLPS